jgi:hypothetical protein
MTSKRMTVADLRNALDQFPDDAPIRAEAINGGSDASVGDMRMVDGELEIDIN